MKVLLIVLDKYSKINNFPLGIGYLASHMRKYHDVKIYNQEVYHYSNQHLLDYLNDNNFDVVGMGVYGYQQYRKCLEVCDVINKSKNRPCLVLGANGPTAAPEHFLKKTKADFVVLGEGEIVFENLLNGCDIQSLNGIAYLNNNDQLVINSREELINDIDTIEFPAWDLFPMEHYVLNTHVAAQSTDRCMSILGSRGCPYNCYFCHKNFSGYRRRSVENIVEEIKELQHRYGVTHITFEDENLMASSQMAIQFANGILDSGINIDWNCMGRIGVAKPEVLKIMKKAGCKYINYGIESLDQNVLDLMNKKQKVEDINEGIENTLNAGIYPGLNMLWGSLGDNDETIKKNTEFLIKYNSDKQVRTIKPVTPYPGTEFFRIAVKKGLLKDVDDFYHKYQNSDRMTVNFTDVSDDKFYELLFKSNKAVVESYYQRVSNNVVEGFRKCYFENDINFRGPRHK